MDLPATFQSSFQQMIIKVKQDVVIDIHRRIDHQASAIYQLFLAEYQRKSPSSSSGTALDQGPRTLTPTPAPIMTAATGNVLRKGQRLKMATRSSTQQQQQQQQSSSSSSNTPHQASTSTASTARPFHRLSGSGDQNSNSSTEGGSANQRTTTTKTSSTHKDPNWIADFEENDCSCEDCKVDAEEEDEGDEGEGESDQGQTGHHHSRLLEDGSTALQPIVSMDTSSDGHSHSQDQQQQQQGMQYQEQGHYPQHHPQQQHLQQNIDHQQPQPHQQHSHHPHHPHHPHHQPQQQNTFIPTPVSTSPVAQPIRSSANYKAQHGGGGGCNNGATVGGNNNSNSTSNSNSAGTMVCPEPGCGKYFDQMSRYKRHINYHYKIKPYRCRYPGCSYASTESCNVVSHVRIRHFRLPKSKEKQRELEIVDDRDPKQYVETVRELL